MGTRIYHADAETDAADTNGIRSETKMSPLTCGGVGIIPINVNDKRLCTLYEKKRAKNFCFPRDIT